MNCASCGAKLAGQEIACKYCGVPTPWGAQRQAEAARVQAAQAQIVAQSQQQRVWVQTAAVQGSARAALGWALAGFVFFCFLIPSIVALVFARKSAREAKAAGVPVPGIATVATVLAGLQLVAFAGFVLLAVVSSVTHDREVASLKKLVEPKSTAATLDRDTACAMAHLHVLEHGYGTASGSVVEDFQCDGKLGQKDDRAWLDEVRLKPGSGAKQTKTAVCFKKGARWIVDDLRALAPCPGSLADVAPVPLGTATPAPTPTRAAIAPAAPVDAGAKDPLARAVLSAARDGGLKRVEVAKDAGPAAPRRDAGAK